jgi:hypothetical protein
MNKQEFKVKMKELMDMGAKYKWQLLGCDSQNFRVSLQDDMRIFRMDVYVSKGTVVFGRVGSTPDTTRNNTMNKIEAILKNPFQ